MDLMSITTRMVSYGSKVPSKMENDKKALGSRMTRMDDRHTLGNTVTFGHSVGV